MYAVILIICTRYEVRNPMFHLPDIRHSFGEQSISYCLIKQLNAEEGCGCLHRTGMLEVYNRVKTIIVFPDVYLVDNMYNVET